MEDNKLLSCKFCPHTATRARNLKLHKTLKHNECQKCGKTQGSLLSLFNHQESMHPSYKDMCKVERCTKCELITTGFVLKKHIRFMHTKDKRLLCDFKCNKCDFTANIKSHLRNHLQASRKAKEVLICKLCSFKSCTKVMMSIHERIVHVDTHQGFHACNNCDMTFKMKRCVKAHLSKANVHPYKCKFCGFKCCTKRGFILHRSRSCKQSRSQVQNEERPSTDLPRKTKTYFYFPRPKEGWGTSSLLVCSAGRGGGRFGGIERIVII